MTTSNQQGSQSSGDQTKLGTVADANLATQEQMETLEQSVARIEKAVSAGQQLNADDNALIKQLLEDEGEGDHNGKGAQEKTGALPNGADLDSMSRAQLVETILQAVRGEIGGLEGRIGKQLQRSSTLTFEQQVKDEIRDARGKYGQEFDDAYEATMKVASKHPRLAVEQAFLLAKAPAYRESLTKKTDDKKREESARGVVTLPDGLTSDALKETVRGKSIRDTVLAIADQIGFNG